MQLEEGEDDDDDDWEDKSINPEEKLSIDKR